jgi:lysophospholipase L1-like esterase
MKDKLFTPFLIVGSVIVLLLAASYFNLNALRILKLKNVDLLSDVRKQTSPKPLPLPGIDADSVFVNSKYKQPTDNTMIIDYGVDSNASVTHFFSKLDAIKVQPKKIRIAYFGDSFIEGDFITDEIRKRFQASYGGNGIGFLPMQSVVESDYLNINFKSNKSWLDNNFISSPNNNILGLTGHVFYANSQANSSYAPRKGGSFNLVKLYTGKSASANPSVEIGTGNISKQLIVSNSNLINETTISTQPIQNIKITSSDSQLPIYGISIEDTHGVYLDNYGFRGNSGLLTNKITEEVMKQFNAYFHYDLIIVHYGLNAVSHGNVKFTWFENAQTKLIQKLKVAFPNTPILLVSTSDIGYNQDGTWITEPGVPYMVNTQRSIAKKNRVAFWDLYSSMGGENTIVNWAQQSPRLAALDYTHLNGLGSKKVADIFYDKILASKSYYENNKIK